MLSTNLQKRAQEDIDFKFQNIEALQTTILELDDQKLLYDQGIVKIEKQVLEDLNVVNRAFDDVSNAYQDAVDSDCVSDLFWRVVDFQASGGADPDDYTLECTRLNGLGYQPTDRNLRSSSGIGSTVAYVGVTGIVSFYPINQTFSNIFEEEYNTADIITDPYFGLDRRNRYGLKIYSEPFDKDIGDTLVGEFIGTCSIGSTFITVMQPVGSGLTFGTNQVIVSSGKTSVIPQTTKIVGVGTTTQDIRSIPSTGIGSTGVVVNVLTIASVTGAAASAPEADGTFVSFRVLEDPAGFQTGGRKRFDIPFDGDPFSPQTISIASTATLGTGVSVYLENTGALSNPRSWDQNLKVLPLDAGGEPEPEVGAGQNFYKLGFGHAPVISGSTRATEGQRRIVSSSSTTFSATLYESLSACSTAINDGITDTLGISSTKETALKAQDGRTNILVESSQALRVQSVQKQLSIHGIRKILGTLNEEADKLESLQVVLGVSSVTEVMQ